MDTVDTKELSKFLHLLDSDLFVFHTVHLFLGEIIYLCPVSHFQGYSTVKNEPERI